MSSSTLKLTLHVWRQKSPTDKGGFVRYRLDPSDPQALPCTVSTDMSFLEMLDVVNDILTKRGDEPIAFDHDCREGICGMCSLTLNGQPHGPDGGTTCCQLHMRRFKNEDVIYVEPFRAKPFPVLKDLVVDRTAFDRIIQAGGYVSVNTGGTPDANALPISKKESDLAFDAAACIGCGACVAACPNASAMLFVSAKLAHLRHLPQGEVERYDRTLKMVEQMDKEGFGNCTNHYECMAACPKEIPVRFIAEMNRDYLVATLKDEPQKHIAGSG